MSIIIKIHADWNFAVQNPTIEVDVITDNGFLGDDGTDGVTGKTFGKKGVLNMTKKC
jgi:hypothetical protein